MKLKHIIKSSLLAGLLLSAGACSDDVFYPDGTWTGEIPDEYTVTLVVPDAEVVNLSNTRATVSCLNVLLYGEDGLIQNTPITDGIDVSDDYKTITVTLPLTQNTKRVEVVVNAPQMSADAYKSKHPSEVPFGGEQAAPVLWGMASIQQTITSGTMVMLRNTAKVSLNNDCSNLQVMEFGVFGTANQGSIAPALAYLGENPTKTELPSDPTIIDGTTFTQETDMKAWSTSDNSLEGFYETPKQVDLDSKDFVRVIFKAKYTNEKGASIDGYYVAAIRKAGAGNVNNKDNNDKYSETPGYFSYECLPMLRNHEYKINVKEVRSEGWPSLDQAKQAMPDNRVVIEVVDDAPSITDIEATRDYYLGVGGNVTVDYNSFALIDIATSYPGLNATNWKDCLVFDREEDDWIKDKDIKIASEWFAGLTTEEKDALSEDFKSQISNFDYNTTVGDLSLRLVVPLDNPYTESSPRYGTLKVQAGKLSRTINITQEGCPYTRRRTVKLYGILKNGSSYTENDYLGWIDGAVYNEDGIQTDVRTDSVKGLTRVANRNLNRNGLHFPAVPLYDYSGYYFTIEKKDGDGTPVIDQGGENFKVELAGNVYKVTMTVSSASEVKRAVGRLRIPANFNGKAVNVDFQLYRTGIIHYLDNSGDYQVPVEKAQRSGWYYYEVVKVKDTYVLDRDLGAASNQYYTAGSSTYKKNKDALGGFFKVNTKRWVNYNKDKTRREDKQTITEALKLHARTEANGKFVLATEADINSWNIDNSSTVSAVASSMPDGKIYFPKGGYYEGDELKSEMHRIFWSRTYLGGTQGLSADAAEYGYWYRYYDDLKSNNTDNRFSNIRMARGSNGQEPDANSVWRYMPLRLVWVDKDCNNLSGSLEPDEPQTVTGKMIIYFEDKQNLTNVKYHLWNINGMQTSFDSPTVAPKVSGQDHLYRIEIGAPTNNDAGILFRYGPSDNMGQTGDFKELYARYKRGETVLYLTNSTTGSNGRYNLICTEAGDQDIYGSSTPVTPSSRPTVTVMLKNDANWTDDCQIEFEDGKSDANRIRTRASKVMTGKKVTYDGDKYYQFILNESDIPALNGDSFQIRFIHSGNTSAYFSEISSKATQNTFFYLNSSSSGYLFNSVQTLITASKLSDGWNEGGTKTVKSVHLLGDFSNGWTGDGETMTGSGSTWTYSVIPDGDKYFRFKVKYSDNTETIFGPGNSNVKISAGETKQASEYTNNNAAFYVSAGTYTISYNPTDNTVTLSGTQADKITIYWNENWSKSGLKIHYWIDANNPITDWNNLPSLSSHSGNWYKYEINRTDVTSFLIKADDITSADYTNLQQDIEKYGYILQYEWIWKDDKHQVKCIGGGVPN